MKVEYIVVGEFRENSFSGVIGIFISLLFRFNS